MLGPQELDDLDLLRLGALGPAAGYGPPGEGPALILPPDTPVPAGTVELVDPEGVLLARVDVDRTYTCPAGLGIVGSVHQLAEPGSRPFARLYLGPAEVRTPLREEPLSVLVTDPLTHDDLATVESSRTGRPVRFLVLAGSDGGRVATPDLLRATLRAAELVGGAEVVAIPLASHGDPDVTAVLRRRVLATYAPGGVLVVDGRGPLPDPVAAGLGEHRRRGTVVLFTGLSGSGKSTLARALHDQVVEEGTRTVTLLDGDVVRRNLSAGLSFSVADRETNVRRIGWVAAEIARHGAMAVCSPIAPFDRTRRQVRDMVEAARCDFVLVHVATPLAECERRDRKGLYASARRGEIPDFTGISSPYEPPVDADVVVDTTDLSVADALVTITAHLGRIGALSAADAAGPA